MNNKGRKLQSMTGEHEDLAEGLFNKVEEITGYTKKVLVSKKRDSDLVMIRMIMASILRNEAHLTFHNIGLILIRDHSSICYYINKHIDNLIYPPYNKLYFNILDRLVHKIKRNDVEKIDAEIEKIKSKLNNLKHKRKLLIWATRRYECSEI